MDKKEIKSKIDEIKAQIKSNAKDAHFAEKLVNDLLSWKGQLDHNATMVNVNLDDIEDKIEGDTFVMYRTRDGLVGFHLKSGYDVVVSPRIEALHGCLNSYIIDKDDIDNKPEEEQTYYKLDFECTQEILTLPLFTATDYDLKYKVCKLFIDTMLEAQKTIEEMEDLPADILKDNILFEDADTALRNIKQGMDNSIED
jgi:hypothetical protein